MCVPVVIECCTTENAYVSKFDGKEWICRTCDSSLSRDVLPKQAKANGMELDNEPDGSREKVDIIACTLYENGSIANW